jgi:hypothetical protein
MYVSSTQLTQTSLQQGSHTWGTGISSGNIPDPLKYLESSGLVRLDLGRSDVLPQGE